MLAPDSYRSSEVVISLPKGGRAVPAGTEVLVPVLVAAIRQFSRFLASANGNTHIWRCNMAIQWSSWGSLPKPAQTQLSRPLVQRNADGRLEVFAIGQGGGIF